MAGPALLAADPDVLAVIPDLELFCKLSVATEAKTASRHPLLLRFVHILEINNPLAPISATLGAKLGKPSTELLVLLFCVFDTNGVCAIGADNLLVLHPGVRAATAKALQRQALAVPIASALITGQGLLGLTGKDGDVPSANDI